MCGIVGTYGCGDEQTLKKMLNVTVHRGEDSTRYRVWSDKCGIGINRLSIVDLDRGDQPLHNEDQDLYVVCNGEIYNHHSIVRELESRHLLRTDSDVEIISHLYEDHGDDCVQFLDGMFAFILYDTKRDTFLAARDPLGIKPFYYAREDRCWFFGSEAKALIDAGVEPQAIRALPPGFRITPQRGPEQYYFMATHRSVPNVRHHVRTFTVAEMSFPRLHEAQWTLVKNLHKTELQRLDRMSMAVSLEARVIIRGHRRCSKAENNQ